jgi:hypothetical protein
MMAMEFTTQTRLTEIHNQQGMEGRRCALGNRGILKKEEEKKRLHPTHVFMTTSASDVNPRLITGGCVA